MILVDANILIYAKMSEFPLHGRAIGWLDDRLNGSTRVGIPWESCIAFMRIVTNPKIFERPLSSEVAWSQVKQWLACHPVWVPRPSDDHRELMDSMLERTRATGNLIHDAHLAAIAMGHGLLLCSTDGDFARFPDLRWENPLSSGVHESR